MANINDLYLKNQCKMEIRKKLRNRGIHFIGQIRNVRKWNAGAGGWGLSPLRWLVFPGVANFLQFILVFDMD